jgi:malate dehydrogenase
MKITIIGAAGTLGSCAAFDIVIHRLADELLLIDPWEDMLKGHWMDLTSASVGLDIDIRQGSYEDMSGTDIVIMTAGAPSGAIKSRSELLPTNLPIVRENAEKITRYCPEAIVIMETNPVDPLNYAMYLMSPSRDRRKYIGYSVNDAIRFRMNAAAALGVKASRVQGMVMGEHGNSQVLLFSTLRLDGQPVKVDAAFKKKLYEDIPLIIQRYEVLKPKRTAGWTSAVGTTVLVNAIKNNTQELVCCQSVLAGEYGYRDTSITVPAIIGRNGLEDIKLLELAPDEKEGLENTVNVLSPYMRYVEEALGLGKSRRA